MRRFFFNPLLLLLVALLFTAGFGHQIFGKYVPHHHAMELAGHHPDEDDDDDQPVGDSGHHCVVAVFAEFAPPLVSALRAVGELDLIADAMPNAVPRGIDVPPQLG